MSSEVVVPFPEPIEPLARIKQRIIAAHERIKHGEANWIDGTLEIAAAMHDARVEVGDSDRRFNHWLKVNNLDFYNKTDRAALIHVGDDLQLARAVFTQEPTISCRALWDRMRERYREEKREREEKKERMCHGAVTHQDATAAKKVDPMRQKPPRATTRWNIARAMKLGEETIAKIKNTPLDTPQEMDAMIELNRIDPTITERLIADALTGSNSVSAVAEVTRLGRKPGPSGKQLVQEFTRRMNSFWSSSSHAAQTDLIDYLMNNMKKG